MLDAPPEPQEQKWSTLLPFPETNQEVPQKPLVRNVKRLVKDENLRGGTLHIYIKRKGLLHQKNMAESPML